MGDFAKDSWLFSALRFSFVKFMYKAFLFIYCVSWSSLLLREKRSQWGRYIFFSFQTKRQAWIFFNLSSYTFFKYIYIFLNQGLSWWYFCAYKDHPFLSSVSSCFFMFCGITVVSIPAHNYCLSFSHKV